MYEIVNEGKAKIKVKKADKISKAMGVFYNPAMKLNRDITILILDCIDKSNLNVALPLAGTGVRGIRLLRELRRKKIRNIHFNDHDAKAVKSIRSNLKLNDTKDFSTNKNPSNNKAKKRARIYNEDANLFLLNSRGFDYIDIDPFGSSNAFLDSGIRRISRNGIIAVTNTDTAALTGTYPKVCVRKYWAQAKKDYMMHETGLRILIRKIQLVGMQYGWALMPIFSYFKDHYHRAFFRCVKGKKECDDIAKKHGILNDAGPLWLGNLWDSRLVNKMCKALLKKGKLLSKATKNEAINRELLRFLKIIEGESKINVAGFFDIHYISKSKNLGALVKKEDLIKRIRKRGFKAAGTHFSGTGIRTDISYSGFVSLLKN